jgi:hypothetical protein
MAVYEIKGPDGGTYEVNAPDDATPEQVLERVRSAAAQPQQRFGAASPRAKPDPFQGKGLDELKQMYRSAGPGSALAPRSIMDAYVNKEADEGGFGYALDDVGRQLAKGVPVVGGALDEINAGTNALMGGNYDETLEYNRARDRLREKLNPESSAAVQLAGGIAGTAAGARYLPMGVGDVARPLLQRSAIGAAAGVPVGAADFFARGEGGFNERAMDAGLGGLVGGSLGAIAPGVGALVSPVVRNLMNLLSSDAALSRLGISRSAANVLLRQLSTDDTLSGAGAARIAEGGPDAMLADAGPAATNLLDTALERSGPGSTAARQRIEQRAAGANTNLTAEMDQTLGAPVGVDARQEAIRRGSSAQRSSEYNAAYDAPIDYASPEGQQLEAMLERVDPRALEYANSLMRKEGLASRQIRFTVNADGTVRAQRMPDVRQWDYITQSLQEAAYGTETRGALGGLTRAGRVDRNTAQEARGLLRQLVPEYGQALNTASDVIGRIEGLEVGEGLLSTKVTRDALARDLRGMSAGERQSVRAGLRDELEEIAANVSRMASDPNIEARELRETLQKLTSRAARDKISLVVGDPQRANALYSQIGRAMRALELRASVARNSRTFGRKATDEQVKAQLEPGIVGLAMQGEVPRAAKKLIQKLSGMTPERQLALEDRLYGEISDALTRVRGTAAERYLQQLQRALAARTSSRTRGYAAGERAGRAVVGGAPAIADYTGNRRNPD